MAIVHAVKIEVTAVPAEPRAQSQNVEGEIRPKRLDQSINIIDGVGGGRGNSYALYPSQGRARETTAFGTLWTARKTKPAEGGTLRGTGLVRRVRVVEMEKCFVENVHTDETFNEVQVMEPKARALQRSLSVYSRQLCPRDMREKLRNINAKHAYYLKLTRVTAGVCVRLCGEMGPSNTTNATNT